MAKIGFQTLLITSLVLSLSPAKAQSDQDPMLISDPQELKSLITEKSMDAKYWINYFRKDRLMASGFTDAGQYSDIVAVRGWHITDEGELCLTVFSMPGRVIDCPKIFRSVTAPDKYRYTTGDNRSYQFQLIEPWEKLTNAII